MQQEIFEAVDSITSDKVSQRRKSAVRLCSLLQSSSIEDIIDKQRGWNVVFSSLKSYISREADFLESTSRLSSCEKQILEASSLAKVVSSLCCKRRRIKLDTVLQHVLNVLNDDFAYKCYGNAYLTILSSELLTSKYFLYSLFQSNCCKLLQSLINNFDYNKINVKLFKTLLQTFNLAFSYCSVSHSQIRCCFDSIINKGFIKNLSKQSLYDMLTCLNSYFETYAVEQRKYICSLGETLIPVLIDIWSTSNQQCQLNILRCFQLQLRIHSPLLQIRSEITLQSDRWSTCISNVFQLLFMNDNLISFFPIEKKGDVKLIYSTLWDCSYLYFVELNGSFLESESELPPRSKRLCADSFDSFVLNLLSCPFSNELKFWLIGVDHLFSNLHEILDVKFAVSCLGELFLSLKHKKYQSIILGAIFSIARHFKTQFLKHEDFQDFLETLWKYISLNQNQSLCFEILTYISDELSIEQRWTPFETAHIPISSYSVQYLCTIVKCALPRFSKIKVFNGSIIDSQECFFDAIVKWLLCSSDYSFFQKNENILTVLQVIESNLKWFANDGDDSLLTKPCNYEMNLFQFNFLKYSSLNIENNLNKHSYSGNANCFIQAIGKLLFSYIEFETVDFKSAVFFLHLVVGLYALFPSNAAVNDLFIRKFPQLFEAIVIFLTKSSRVNTFNFLHNFCQFTLMIPKFKFPVNEKIFNSFEKYIIHVKSFLKEDIIDITPNDFHDFGHSDKNGFNASLYVAEMLHFQVMFCLESLNIYQEFQHFLESLGCEINLNSALTVFSNIITKLPYENVPILLEKVNTQFLINLDDFHDHDDLFISLKKLIFAAQRQTFSSIFDLFLYIVNKLKSFYIKDSCMKSFMECVKTFSKIDGGFSNEFWLRIFDLCIVKSFETFMTITNAIIDFISKGYLLLTTFTNWLSTASITEYNISRVSYMIIRFSSATHAVEDLASLINAIFCRREHFTSKVICFIFNYLKKVCGIKVTDYHLVFDELHQNSFFTIAELPNHLFNEDLSSFISNNFLLIVKLCLKWNSFGELEKYSRRLSIPLKDCFIEHFSSLSSFLIPLILNESESNNGLKALDYLSSTLDVKTVRSLTKEQFPDIFLNLCLEYCVFTNFCFGKRCLEYVINLWDPKALDFEAILLYESGSIFIYVLNNVIERFYSSINKQLDLISALYALDFLITLFIAYLPKNPDSSIYVLKIFAKLPIFLSNLCFHAHSVYLTIFQKMFNAISELEVNGQVFRDFLYSNVSHGNKVHNTFPLLRSKVYNVYSDIVNRLTSGVLTVSHMIELPNSEEYFSLQQMLTNNIVTYFKESSPFKFFRFPVSNTFLILWFEQIQSDYDAFFAFYFQKDNLRKTQLFLNDCLTYLSSNNQLTSEHKKLYLKLFGYFYPFAWLDSNFDKEDKHSFYFKEPIFEIIMAIYQQIDAIDLKTFHAAAQSLILCLRAEKVNDTFRLISKQNSSIVKVLMPYLHIKSQERTLSIRTVNNIYDIAFHQHWIRDVTLYIFSESISSEIVKSCELLAHESFEFCMQIFHIVLCEILHVHKRYQRAFSKLFNDYLQQLDMKKTLNPNEVQVVELICKSLVYASQSKPKVLNTFERFELLQINYQLLAKISLRCSMPILTIFWYEINYLNAHSDMEPKILLHAANLLNDSDLQEGCRCIQNLCLEDRLSTYYADRNFEKLLISLSTADANLSYHYINKAFSEWIHLDIKLFETSQLKALSDWSQYSDIDNTDIEHRSHHLENLYSEICGQKTCQPIFDYAHELQIYNLLNWKSNELNLFVTHFSDWLDKIDAKQFKNIYHSYELLYLCYEKRSHSQLLEKSFTAFALKLSSKAIAFREFAASEKILAKFLNVQDAQLKAGMEYSRLFWARNEPEYAIRHLKDLVSSASKSNDSYLPILQLQLAEFLSSNHFASSSVVFDLLSECSLFLSRHSTLFSADDVSRAYLKLAKCSDQLYQSICDYEETAEFQLKQEIHERTLKEVSKFNLNKMESKRNRYAITATKQCSIDENEAARSESRKNQYLFKALDAYFTYFKLSSNRDLEIFRFIDLWFENVQSIEVNNKINGIINTIPSNKFIIAFPQISSRIGDKVNAAFHEVLNNLVYQLICDYPFHTLYNVMALYNANIDADYQESDVVCNDVKISCTEKLLSKYKQCHINIFSDIRTLCESYIELAYFDVSKWKHKTHELSLPSNLKLLNLFFKTSVPIPTKPLSFSDYKAGFYISIERFSSSFNLCGGINLPKVIQVLGSDGVTHRQLVKGRDDLRQDAVMEQVFNVVNMLLNRDSNASSRYLTIRTYCVIPLSQRSGIIEWCEGTEPFAKFLITGSDNAHSRYYPSDWSNAKCQSVYQKGSASSLDSKLCIFNEICANFKPVFRHYFYENFQNPFNWYQHRTIYTRSVACSSIIGYFLGLGDRHTANILLDSSTSEFVHIDLGIAFEQGKLLPTPETIPFRLTRDIIDGFGVTGVEGIYRKSCEITMNAVKTNSDIIMTIVKVLLYDPLYNWCISPEKLRAIQKKPPHNQQIAISNKRSTDSVNILAQRVLVRMRDKLKGIVEGSSLNVSGHVSHLINEATDPSNLCRTYVGWRPWV